MKDISYLIISIVIIGLLSCGKNRTCVCSYYNHQRVDGSIADDFKLKEESHVKMSKKSAEGWCKGSETKYTYNALDQDSNYTAITARVECEVL